MSESEKCRSALPGAMVPGRAQKRAPTTTTPPHQSALRTGRWSWPNHCYFITTNIAGRKPVLADRRAAKIVIDALLWLQQAGRIRLMGFVVMPDHVHVAFELGESQPKSRPEGRSYSTAPVVENVGALFRARSGLSWVMNSFKGYTGKKINELLGRPGELWQAAYHDHRVRDRKDFETRLAYMHANPIRKGIVRVETEYAWSSANPKYDEFIDWAWLDGVQPVAPGRALLQ